MERKLELAILQLCHSLLDTLLECGGLLRHEFVLDMSIQHELEGNISSGDPEGREDALHNFTAHVGSSPEEPVGDERVIAVIASAW